MKYFLVKRFVLNSDANAVEESVVSYDEKTFLAITGTLEYQEAIRDVSKTPEIKLEIIQEFDDQEDYLEAMAAKKAMEVTEVIEKKKTKKAK